jgi:hypothetical protein
MPFYIGGILKLGGGQDFELRDVIELGCFVYVDQLWTTLVA